MDHAHILTDLETVMDIRAGRGGGAHKRSIDYTTEEGRGEERKGEGECYCQDSSVNIRVNYLLICTGGHGG